jgi:hypothetical protein
MDEMVRYERTLQNDVTSEIFKISEVFDKDFFFFLCFSW